MSDDTRVELSGRAAHYLELLHQESYSPEEAAEVLNMKQRTIFSAAFGGDLKAEILNGDVISITRTDLVNWLQRRENQ